VKILKSNFAVALEGLQSSGVELLTIKEAKRGDTGNLRALASQRKRCGRKLFKGFRGWGALGLSAWQAPGTGRREKTYEVKKGSKAGAIKGITILEEVLKSRTYFQPRAG